MENTINNRDIVWPNIHMENTIKKDIGELQQFPTTKQDHSIDENLLISTINPTVNHADIYYLIIKPSSYPQ